MPTRFWLVDPALRDAVSRLEAAGGVRDAPRRWSTPRRWPTPTRRYAAERDAACRRHAGPGALGGRGRDAAAG